MRLTLSENKGIPSAVLWILSIIAGVSVANLYYNQPLLNRISEDFGVSEFTANLIPMTTQIGYALGLLFIIPLGDLYNRKNIIITNFSILVVSLLLIAVAPDIHYVLLASLFTGACSVMPQIFIPIAAQFSTPETKGKHVGMIISGLLTGILASRVVSGMVGEYWGWRTIYYIAAVMMLVCIVVTLRVLPITPVNFNGKYSQLMKSLLELVIRYPMLRVCAARAGLCFGSFLGLWACMAFKMSGAPFYAGNNVIGLLGLCGIAGALTASTVGRYVRILGVRRFNYLGGTLILLAWGIMAVFDESYAGIIAGILIIDIGMQCVQLSNQTSVFALDSKASNRINTIFMTTYFIGGALGTFLAGTCWELWQWPGVVAAGMVLAASSLLITAVIRNKNY